MKSTSTWLHISKNVYIDKLHEIVNSYSNAYHKKIKIKPIDFEDNNYVNFREKVNDKNP